MAAIREVIDRTEGQIAACNAEVQRLDAQVASSEQSHVDKQGALSVASERLGLRATRPPRELVQDNAQRALSSELSELKLGMRLIEGSTMRLLADKERLGKNLADLRETVDLKTHFLEIEYAGGKAHHMQQNRSIPCKRLAPARHKPDTAGELTPFRG